MDKFQLTEKKKSRNKQPMMNIGDELAYLKSEIKVNKRKLSD